MRFATANIKALPLMPQAKVLADITEVADLAGVIGWQEIGPDRYKDAIRSTPRDDLMLNTSTPISHAGHLVVLGYGSEVLHDPQKKVCGPRELTWQHLHDMRTGRSFVHINAHYVPRAWNPTGSSRPRANRREAAQQPMRQQLWLEGNARHKTLIASFVKRGLPVVTTADWNRGGPAALLLGDKVVGQRVQYAKHGLDAIAFIDGATRTRRGSRWVLNGRPLVVDLNSDHAAVIQRAHIGR